ncbi:MAG: nucleotidyltransferase domain-containing protein [Patescibacteria group bacterium]
MEKDEIIREIVGIIRHFLPKDYKIFLFGSWAKGTALETSDLDIAILGPKAVDQEIMIRIKSSVDGIPTLRSMDIVDLNLSGEEFKNRALKHSRVLD